MKILSILYFTLFLSFGNALLSSAHEIKHKHHCCDQHVEVECNECIILNSLDTYTIDKFIKEFSPTTSIKFQLETYDYFSNGINLNLKSRAPPQA
tara:strand:+ start:703 stop:987 length:285 start_codon:yes stop_codon:yes gene_type:complete